MDEVDRRIGLQQVAPDAQPRIGLAGHQQHPQAVADAVDEEHLPVVERRHLARPRLGLDLEHGLARAGQLEGHGARAARRRLEPLAQLTVLPEGHRRPGRRCRAGQLLDAQGQLLLARRPWRSWAPRRPRGGGPARPGAPVSSTCKRRVDAAGARGRRHVVHLAVGEDHHARQGATRSISARLLAQRRRTAGCRPCRAVDGGLDAPRGRRAARAGAQLLERSVSSWAGRWSIVCDGVRSTSSATMSPSGSRCSRTHHRIGQRQDAEQSTAPRHRMPRARRQSAERAQHEGRERERGEHRPRQQGAKVRD